MIHNLKPYPAYKDSGVPWLGEVPEHWEISRVKNEFTCLNSRRVPLSATERGLMSVRQYDYYGASGVIDKVDDYLFDDDLLLIAEDGANLVLRNLPLVIIARGKFWVNNHAHILKLKRGSLEYLANLMETLSYLPWISGAAQPKLTQDRLMSIIIAVPPFLEQNTISRFLNYFDRRIRRYIRTKRKLIKLLEEQKQAIIQKAVTRGLDPNVKLKSSGVEWLGDVPGHWEVKPAKWFCREIDERSSTGSEELLSVSHITGVTPRSEKNITMFMAESYVGYKLCRENDLVINTMWAWMAALGVSQQAGIVSYSYGVYRPIHENAFLSRYIDLLLRTKPYVAEYICRSTGIHSSRLRLYPEQFLRIPIIRPPIEEQQAILDEIHNITSELQLVINTSNQEISLLSEYRIRLIADIVTGKLDVREAVKNLPEELDESEILEEELAEDEEITEEDINCEPEEE